jgi:hypothetical protein
MVTNDKTGVSKLETISLKTFIIKKTYLADANEWQFEAIFQPDPQEIFEDNIQIS